MFKNILSLLLGTVTVLSLVNCDKSNKGAQTIDGEFVVPTAACLNKFDCRPSNRFLNRIAADKDLIAEYPRLNSDKPYYVDHSSGYSKGLCGCPAGTVPAYENGSLLCAKISGHFENRKIMTWDLQESAETQFLGGAVAVGVQVKDGDLKFGLALSDDKYSDSYGRGYKNKKHNRWGKRKHYGQNDGYGSVKNVYDNNYQPSYGNNSSYGSVKDVYDDGYKPSYNNNSNYGTGNSYNNNYKQVSYQFAPKCSERTYKQVELVTPNCTVQVAQTCDLSTSCGGGYSCQTYAQKDYGLCGSAGY